MKARPRRNATSPARSASSDAFVGEPVGAVSQGALRAPRQSNAGSWARIAAGEAGAVGAFLEKKPRCHVGSGRVGQKEIVASTPHRRGSEIDANGVPNVSVVMLLMPVTYWSSSTFVT